MRFRFLPLALAVASGCHHEQGDAASSSATASDDAPAPPVAGEEGDDPPQGPLGTPPPAGSAQSALLAEVDRQLGAVKSSTYLHHAHVDEASGAFDYDCSGFLDYALARVVPDALAAVQATTPRRPRSKDYVAFLAKIPPGEARGRWERVGLVKDLVPGDVIVWLKPADSPSTNTGHTMIVHGPPSPDPEHAGAFVVPIVDSTEHPHVPGDARAPDHRTGLGRGEIVLLTDGAGAAVGYRWSRGRKSREKATTIALGRLR